MFTEQTRDLLVHLADLLLDQLQVVQCQSYKPTVDRVEFGAGAQRVAQLGRGSTPVLIGQSGQRCRIVAPSASACSIRRALAPSRSETKLDNLIWASSSSASS